MVQFSEEPMDRGADIPIRQKMLIYAGIVMLFFICMVFYRRKPFLSFYVLSSLMTNIGLGFLINPQDLNFGYVIKMFLLAIPFLSVSLWRISSISDTKFERFFAGFKLNVWTHRVLKGKINDHFMEYLCSCLLFVNMIWAAYYDIVQFESYLNGCNGLILALTVPLPSSIGHGTPGWSVASDNDDQKVDVVIPDHHWLWITVYTSWNLRFVWMYSGNVFRAPSHLIPCFLYALIAARGRNDIWMMMRMVNIYVMAMCWTPLGVSEYVLGDHLPIQNPNVPIIWGAINLFLAVIWLAYYLNMWWKRVRSTTTSTKKDETDLSDVVGKGQEQGPNSVPNHTQKVDSTSTTVAV